MTANAGRKEVIKETKSYVAGADLSSSDNLFVKLDANGEIVLAGDGDEIKGVLLNTPAAGEAGEVALINAGNIVRVVSGAAVTTGGKVASDAAGKVINSGSGDIEVGQADEGAGATDEYSIIQLTRGGVTA